MDFFITHGSCSASKKRRLHVEESQETDNSDDSAELSARDSTPGPSAVLVDEPEECRIGEILGAESVVNAPVEENQEVDDPPDQDSGDSTVEDYDVDVAMDDDVLGESQDQDPNYGSGHQGGDNLNNRVGPGDISRDKDSPPVQPSDIQFPAHMIGKQFREKSHSEKRGGHSGLAISMCKLSTSARHAVLNFLSILSLIAKHDDVIAEKICSGSQNSKYTHHSVQNALLDIMKDMVFEEIREELNPAKFFAVLADESKDKSKKEQVVVAVRYCFQNAIHEEFISVAEAQSLDANGLTDTIIESLNKIGVDMKNCVGQGYDGASVVSGHLNGVQRKLIEKTGATMAHYVHCFCHRLNLIIVDVVNLVKCVSVMISLFRKLHNFISSSTVHAKWEKKQADLGLKKMETGRVSDTRWSCQAKQFDVLSRRLPVLYEVLEDIIENDNVADRVTEASGLKLQLDCRFVRYLFAVKEILQKAKYTSDMLQKPSNDLLDAIDLIGTMREEIGAFRSRESCLKFWEEAQKVADEIGLPATSRAVRRRAPPAALEGFAVEAPIETSRRENSDSPEFDSYVQDVYEIIDKVDAEFERRYNKDNIAIMKGITSLCPTSSKYLDQSALEEFAALFGADIEALSHEVCTFKCLLKRKEEAERPGSLLDLRAYLQELKAAFFELERIVSIACTLPGGGSRSHTVSDFIFISFY
ncbi:Zinc finger MYM-type protein 1 [Holothuria leucospilota]|uniref:Zinc finger MYM-type protein 1 n=1 Tax=Holothuria leucospilota TaxID=206669 RepID=A0A9Q1BPG2_HOLLE|nr:Zinc finger MYM-type protein 1 [Holothuria leucospilota]